MLQPVRLGDILCLTSDALVNDRPNGFVENLREMTGHFFEV